MNIEIHGGGVKIDECDIELFKAHRWHMNKLGYLVAHINRRAVLFHRLIMSAKKGFEVDHINGDPSDNTRANLRICTRSENGKNRKKNKNNCTGFKGVFFSSSKKNPYRAQIKVDGNTISLGLFPSAIQAFVAYIAASKKYHGEFGRII